MMAHLEKSRALDSKGTWIVEWSIRRNRRGHPQRFYIVSRYSCLDPLNDGREQENEVALKSRFVAWNWRNVRKNIYELVRIAR